MEGIPMQEDFHYYATYCAAFLAGYSHEQSLAICSSAQFVDCCSRSFLQSVHAPLSAAATQLQLELMNSRMDNVSLRNITGIWAAFHFLPFDLYARVPGASSSYRNKYRLICDTNGDLLVNTVLLAKGHSLQAAGIAMHVLADTWAHRYFAGTPSLVINNTDFNCYELIPDGGTYHEQRIRWRHNISAPDDPQHCTYSCTMFQGTERSIMNLGHGRAGHLPDYSYARYRYLPAWGNYAEVTKDNPSDYWHAFCQMIYALEFLRGQHDVFEKDTYSFQTAAPYQNEILSILERRQLNACTEWKALGEQLSGCEIPDFCLEDWSREYAAAAPSDKEATALGRFIPAAIRHKKMVTDAIRQSGNNLV